MGCVVKGNLETEMEKLESSGKWELSGQLLTKASSTQIELGYEEAIPMKMPRHVVSDLATVTVTTHNCC